MEHNKRMGMDEEEIKRFERAFSLCRTCNHIMMAHTFLKNKRGNCIETKLAEKDKYGRCICESFIPKDNLEFLEWIEKNKESEE
jgi:hypothetical protein